MTTGPLSGIRILDLTQFMQGPWATQLLGDMGADVIKLEPPGGEWERHYTFSDVWLGGESALFLAMNRNKRSIVVDLKEPAGRRVALDLAADVDVLVENSRPGVMERLGLGYEDVKEVNDHIIYASATGYGADGPYARRPGQDLLVQSLSGLASITGAGDGPPVAAGTPIADEHGARLLSLGIVMALFHRERTGQGQHVQSSLLAGLIDAQCQELVTALNGGVVPQRSPAGIAHAMTPAPYGIYPTADGHLALAQGSLSVLAEVTGLPRLSEVEEMGLGFDARDEVKALLDDAFPKRPTDEWIELLVARDFWCARVNDYAMLPDDPQVVHAELLTTMSHPKAGQVRMPNIPIRMSASPGGLHRPPPLCGEHTEDVLREVGYSTERIAELRRDGVTQ